MSRQKKITKTVHVDVTYFIGRQDPERGVFEGGVPHPMHLDEITVDIGADEVFDSDQRVMRSSGKLQVHLRGSRRAYMELSRYLVTLCEMETLDPDYHDHFDDLLDSSRRPSVHLIAHAPPQDGARHRPDSSA